MVFYQINESGQAVQVIPSIKGALDHLRRANGMSFAPEDSEVPEALARAGVYLYTPPAYDPARQTLGELVLSGNGCTHEVVDIPAATIRESVLEQLKAIRRSALDSIARSAGVSAIYEENRRVAQMILGGQADAPVIGSLTAQQFAEQSVASMGHPGILDSVSWATYIMAENTRERLRGKKIEDGYLSFAYDRLNKATTPEQMLALPGEFQARVEELLAAKTAEEVQAL